MSIVLASGPDSLPPTPALHLLPFSLTPTPASAPISTYFRPRTAPDSHPCAGRQIAAFRGRQIVAQNIPIPKGYNGVILRAEGIPGSGGAGINHTSTTASTSTSTLTSTSEPPLPDSGSGRVTRARGAGQVALSRPRTRRAVPKRKFILDDDEDEPPRQRVKVSQDEPEPEAQPERPVTPEAIPAIRVVAATPGNDLAGDSVVSIATSVECVEAVVDDGLKEVEIVETESLEIVSSAVSIDGETEDRQLSSTLSCASVTAVSVMAEEETPARILTPMSQFSSFALWTPDAPLAGFDPEEVVEDGGWRRGGAGDGGDEFVRALGEWLAVCDIIHAPLYGDEEEEE